METYKSLNNRWFCGIFYMISIIVGNLLVSYFGIIKFMGLTFPTGAILIGLTFSLRDLVQREWGDCKVWYFMLISTLITSILSVILSNLSIPPWKVALASAVAFLISEAVDWFVYLTTKLDIIWRIIISNLFSTPIDSILFVGIAFGTFDFLQPPVYGQAIVKYLSGLIVLPFLIYFRNKNKIRKRTDGRIFPSIIE